MEPRLEDVALAPGEAHVWRASLDLPLAQLGELAALLSDDELARAARFKFDRDRNWYIAGRGILRRTLAGYLHTGAPAIRFAYGPQGKPSLPGEPLQFNVSHTSGEALYAFSLDAELGIDIERLNPAIEVEKIAANFFSPAEVAAILALPPDRRHILFFDFWTRKEAYLKALGHGLSIPLNEFDVSSLAEIDHPGFPKSWVYPLDAPPGFAAALVTMRPLARYKIANVTV